MNRFKWLDNERFQYINTEGIERIISIKDQKIHGKSYEKDYKIVSYN